MSKSCFSCLRACGLPFVVFFTGAGVLVLEILATRILSPYFGNTIFTVSSIISTVLAALSIGYWWGGRLADRRPEYPVFFGLIFLGGLGVLLTAALIPTLLQDNGYKLPMTTGPLVFSVALFFLPSVLLGMLSPFAVKLQAEAFPERGTGRVAGEIFFWSTLGSITGSLATGFLLVPHFGVLSSVLGTGAALAGFGFVMMILSGGYKRKGALAAQVVVGAVCAGFLSHAMSIPPPSGIGLHLDGEVMTQKILHTEDGLYEKITVTYTENLRGHKANILLQDHTYSAMIYLDSDEPAAEYTKYYALYRVLKPDMASVLAIGGGGYAVPGMILDEIYDRDITVDAVEIEPSLFALSQKFFGIDGEDPRLTNHITDGRRFLHDTQKSYDMIFSDVYQTLYSVPTHFTTTEFFETAKARLNPSGIFLANLIGNVRPGTPNFILSEIKTFCAVFSNCYLFGTKSGTTLENQNFIMVGVNGDARIDYESDAVLSSENETIRNLKAHAVDIAALDLGPHLVLTDDYAPVDYMAALALKESVSQAGGS